MMSVTQFISAIGKNYSAPLSQTVTMHNIDLPQTMTFHVNSRSGSSIPSLQYGKDHG